MSEEVAVPEVKKPRDYKNTCEDYNCEWQEKYGEHSHVGVQPYLRRVMRNFVVIDGATGEPI